VGLKAAGASLKHGKSNNILLYTPTSVHTIFEEPQVNLDFI
jgi:hypothetical protein